MIFRWVRYQVRRNSPGLYLFFITAIAVLFVFLQASFARSLAQTPQTQTDEQLPALQVHPLPPSLSQWRSDSSENYLAAIQPTLVGYLIWSRFPVKVFIEPVSGTDLSDRSQEWVNAVGQAVKEWQAYLPLEFVSVPAQANISFWRNTPPLRQESQASQTNQAARPFRAQAAETRYELFVDRSISPAILSHRFTIRLRSGQTATYILASARHELGHALGIWGHSTSPTDVMYFSQVRNPPLISKHDINTLKQIYQQPTRLGWPVSGK